MIHESMPLALSQLAPKIRHDTGHAAKRRPHLLVHASTDLMRAAHRIFVPEQPLPQASGASMELHESLCMQEA